MTNPTTQILEALKAASSNHQETCNKVVPQEGGGWEIYDYEGYECDCAASKSTQALAAMQGMVLVPVSASDEMIWKGKYYLPHGTGSDQLDRAYTAMIAPYVNKEDGI